ncbi:MAG: septum formation initiator family protein [Malacoplasma sp.]
MTKKSKKDNRRITILLMVFIPLLGFFVYNMFSSWVQIYKNIQQKKELDTKYASILKEENVLKSEMAKLQNPEYVARYAREKYLYSKDGELIIKIGEWWLMM